MSGVPLPQFKQFWLSMTSGLWFLPLAMVALAIILAVTAPVVDDHLGHAWVKNQGVFFGVGADGARGMLSAIAGSMMTVASLTFSLTISTLAAASAQYTSRLVRNFMRDRVNQFVLGYFVSLFAYCLIVLRTIRGGDEGQFVPAIAVLLGLALALVSIAVLIYFIHHIADSIQASTILHRVTAETAKSIDRLFPADIAEPVATAAEIDVMTAVRMYHHRAKAEQYGYVQAVDTDILLKVAGEFDGVVKMVVDIGTFVTPGGVIVELDSDKPIKDDTIKRLRKAFSMGAARTIEQDAAFGIRQLVDMALKALSPGINDTTTAVMSVNHLGVLLESLARRPIPSHLRGEDGSLRIIATGRSFQTLVGLSLDQIRQNAPGNPPVLTAMLLAIAAGGQVTRDRERHAHLKRHAELLRDLCERSIDVPADRDPVLALADRTITALSQNHRSEGVG